MPSPPGHPAHQLRQFTVTFRYGAQGLDHPVEVMAQTRDDAIDQATFALAAARVTGNPALWFVTGVHDPAPHAWIPPQEGGEH